MSMSVNSKHNISHRFACFLFQITVIIEVSLYLYKKISIRDLQASLSWELISKCPYATFILKRFLDYFSLLRLQTGIQLNYWLDISQHVPFTLTRKLFLLSSLYNVLGLVAASHQGQSHSLVFTKRHAIPPLLSLGETESQELQLLRAESASLMYPQGLQKSP